MKIIFGLGNNGVEYNGTRHNVGFEVLDLMGEMKDNTTVWKQKNKFESMIKELNIDGERVVLVKPLTFMNLSGRAVKKAMQFFNAEVEDIFVVHDELDLPVGRMKIKIGGGVAGHHGLQSIVECVGSADFVRIRIGIGKDMGQSVMTKKDGANYVLGIVRGQEKKTLQKVFVKCVEALECCLKMDVEKCASIYN